MLAPLFLCFRFKFRLDCLYTFGDISFLRLRHFGWKTPLRANFRRFFNFWPPKIVSSLFKPQKKCYSRRNTHFDVSLVKIGPTVWPLAALKNEQKIIKAQTINSSPLRGHHVPEPIDMPFSVLTTVTDIIIPAKFCLNPLMGFWEGAPPIVPFLILFGTTVTTFLHYRADCD